ncbi:MAG: outer membrane beta-barrel protein [Deltaproteobacteria bacterium]|nr:outer membrane beta-barrel protein [Deltaproteobacteria bacterium]
MKKLFLTAIAAGVVGVAASAFAVDGDFEMSGHVNAGVGYQKFSSSADAAVAGAAGANTFNGGAVQRGSIGDLTGNNGGAAGQNEFIFFVDEAELDATKSFGENIKVRADFAFGRVASGSAAAFALEQAYATINIPVGNGMEFLLGRFDAPIGFESVERGENTLFSHGAVFTYLRPTSFTGMKFYYPFSDMVDLHVYIVNNLRDTLTGVAFGDSVLPSFGTRVGLKWGDEGKKSTIGLSLASGPEATDGSKMGDWSHVADLDWNVWIGESFAIGGEGIFRIDNGATGATDARYFGGQLNLHYAFTDTWDGTLRFGYVQSRAADADTLTGAAASLLDGASAGKVTGMEATFGVQYHIDDNAKIQWEGRYDLVKNAATAAGNGHVYGGAVNFAYNF